MMRKVGGGIRSSERASERAKQKQNKTMTNKEPSFPFCLLTAFVKTTKKKQDLDE
jgi:hypothetical protein